MEFQKEDLFIYEDTDKFLGMCGLPTNQSRLLVDKLKKYVIICNRNLYQLQKNTTYILPEYSTIDDKLTTIITNFLCDSITCLDEANHNKLKIKYKNDYKNLCSYNSINKYMKNARDLLTNDKIVMDSYEKEIHFKNGYIDLSTKEFNERVLGKHYVTKFVDRDYMKSNMETQKDLLRNLSKIVPNASDFKAFLQLFGATLSGTVTREQICLFLMGTGSAGKSTIWRVTKEALPDYCVELKSDVFTGSDANTSKVLNTYSEQPQLLFSFVNEFDDRGRVNSSIFKKFCEGVIQTTKLYKEGVHDCVHKTLIICDMNTIPNFIADSGVIRRLKAYEFKSRFVEKSEDTDEANNVYLMEKDFYKALGDEQKNAWVDILSNYAHKYLHGEKIQFTSAFETSKTDLVASNDVFAEFIESKLIITKDDSDRIYGKDLRIVFDHEFPDKKYLTRQQFHSSLRDKGIKYDCDKRRMLDGNNKGSKGLFYCVKWKEDPWKPKDDFSCLDIGIPSDKKTGFELVFEKLRRIDALRAEMVRLNNEVNAEIQDIFSNYEQKVKNIAKEDTENDFSILFPNNI